MINVIDRVLLADMCIGCGSCASWATAGKVRMVNREPGVLRPQAEMKLSREESAAFERICPGVSLKLESRSRFVDPIWGPVESLQTGWSSDGEVRFRGSSGGVISSLLIDLLDTGAVDFVAHIGASTADPLRNDRRISRNRGEVLCGAGSRYAPSAPLEQLEDLFESGERFAFVGKPCDVAALRAHLLLQPDWNKQVVAVISFMCAGVPSFQGTEELLNALGTKSGEVVQFDYRGNGWPGFATATTRDGKRLQMDYNRSWGGILGRHLQLRCKLCPDGTGEFADVVCADAWYGKDGYPDFAEREGRSLIVSRTPLGKSLVAGAVARGRLVVESCRIDDVGLMQPYQLARKRVVVGRLMALVLRRGLWPRFEGLRLWANAWNGGGLPVLRNLWGTFRRLT